MTLRAHHALDKQPSETKWWIELKFPFVPEPARWSIFQEIRFPQASRWEFALAQLWRSQPRYKE